MQNFLRIAQGLPVMALLAAIRRKPDLWKVDTYLQDYPQGPFGEVESIILRFPPVTVYELEADAKEHLEDRRYDPHECVDRDEYRALPQARPLVMNLMHFVGGERLGRVMINKIAPGGHIFPHADTPEHADYWDRHHIVLQSQPGANFRCEEEQVCMAPGDCWWFNNSLEHEVNNNSADDRIHMIVDIRTS